MAINWPKIEYVEAEDGMLDPKLDYPKQPAGNVGKYGEMRRRYLQEHSKAQYTMMMLEGTLKQHLMDVNEEAHQQIEALIEGLLKVNPAPDKPANQLGWIQHMNMLRLQAEEIVLRELIYT